MSDEVLITSDKSKLPADIAALLDPAAPLPPGVEHFEKQYTVADMLHTLWITLVLIILGFLGLLFGIATLFERHVQTGVSVSLYPLGFGVVCAIVAWMMLASIWTRWKFRRQQLAGQRTRQGIFLTPTSMVQVYEFDTTVIPRSAYIDLDGDEVKYRLKDQEKRFRLPSSLVGDTPDRLRGAIHGWSRRTS